MEHTTAKRRTRRGAMLLELIAALSILSIGLMGMVQVYHASLETMKAMGESRLALQLVQNEIERLHALPYSALTVGTRDTFGGDPQALSRLVNAAPQVLIHERTVKGLRVKEVTAGLTWSGQHGRRIEKRLTTLIADKRRGAS